MDMWLLRQMPQSVAIPYCIVFSVRVGYISSCYINLTCIKVLLN